MTIEHPNNEHLNNYIQGLLDEEQTKAIDAHIDNCERCTDLLEEFSPEDTSFVSVIQSAWKVDVLANGRRVTPAGKTIGVIEAVCDHDATVGLEYRI